MGCAAKGGDERQVTCPGQQCDLPGYLAAATALAARPLELVVCLAAGAGGRPLGLAALDRSAAVLAHLSHPDLLNEFHPWLMECAHHPSGEERAV